MKLRMILPLILFIGIVIVLWRGLQLHPNQVPSPLINKPAPAFSLTTLADQHRVITHKNLLGHVTLINVWATWCYACSEEHAFLLQLANNKHFVLIGLDYKDDPKAAKKWLQQQGNPYQEVMLDTDGASAIDWGVYGTPETFIIDQKGIIRYKHIGPITPDAWEHDLYPLIQTLEKAS